MAYQFKARRRVEFSDTDMAGIMHFSNFFKFMETAEHAFWRSLGFSIADPASEVGWPRVHASCDFSKPLRFEDTVEIHLLVREVRTKAIRYEFRFRRLNGAGPEEVARGSVTIVSVKRLPGGGMKAVSLPAKVRARIKAAPAKLFEDKRRS